jgi:putative transferase (TIGR04331 family)
MMKQCRVAAINYLGSAFGQALILNTPLVLFFRLGSYTLTPSGYEVLQSFQEAGIFHETPEQAASFIARIWDSVPDWWNSDVVQAARKEYLRLDADAAGDDILWTWVKNALRV